MAIGFIFLACNGDTGTPPQYIPPEENKFVPVPVDYTAGRIMNARLGRGINLGNSWESDGFDDAAWSNPIRDTDFATIKAAGFNSVRIPVRWQNNSDYTDHTVDPKRLAGVMEDISLAIANGLAVVVNFHHYVELNNAGEKKNYTSNPAAYEAEKAHFLALWAQVATVMDAQFPDSMLVFEILNEPTIPYDTLVDKLMLDAYNVIRGISKGKTIMFESYHAAKFADISILHLPPDGNIIYSGHYYEPYSYTHQGPHGNPCNGDVAKVITADKDLQLYDAMAMQLYPDINGKDHVPMNMGEFGVAGGDPFYGCETAPSSEGKAQWANEAAKAALKYGMSFHYWGFGQTGGFDAYNVYSETWYPGFPQALIF